MDTAQPVDPQGFTLSAWERELAELGAPRYRAEQVFSWLHARRATGYAAMTNLPRQLREQLARRLPWRAAAVAGTARSRDGAVKYLFRAEDGAAFEAVFLPAARGASLCVSVQAGCSFACAFCATGRSGFQRNLRAGEILQQVYTLAEAHGLSSYRVLLMGMGEPLANLDATVRALQILRHPRGQALAPRRLTVSTVGLRGRIARLAREVPGVELALSLHFTTQEQRQRYLPAARRFPLPDLFAELSRAESFSKVTLEYLLLAGVNDTAEDAAALAALAHGVVPRARKVEPPARLRSRFRALVTYHVNLIKLNPAAGSPFLPTPYAQAESFQNYLKTAGITATYRRSVGSDIAAACGMLAGQAASAAVGTGGVR